MDKKALQRQLLELLREEREVLVAAQKHAAEGAMHEESRAESDKDMRATEASYLARGQALRVAELDVEIARIAALQLIAAAPGAAIAAGALVSLSSPRGRRQVFLLPAGAGRRLVSEGAPISVVTPVSPLGSTLLGAHEGQDVDVELGDRVETYRILRVT